MPLLSGLSRAYRDKAQRLEDERMLRAGEAMRIAPLPEIPVQPARRSVVAGPAVLAPALVGAHRQAAGSDRVVPSIDAGRQDVVIDLRDGVEHQRRADPPPPAVDDADGPAPLANPLTYRWDNAIDLLRRLPRLNADDHAGGGAASAPSHGWDDALELLRRLPGLDPDTQPGDETWNGSQGELEIVWEAQGLMSETSPSADAESTEPDAG